MKKILVSIGDVSGINLFLLFKSAEKFPQIEFDVLVDKNIADKFSKKFKIKIPENLDFIDVYLVDYNFKHNDAGLLSILSLETAVRYMKKKRKNYYGLLTLPLNKNSVSECLKDFRGHTEYFAGKFKTKTGMLLYSEKISAALLSTHVNLQSVCSYINKKNVVSILYLIQEFYGNYFKIKPKITALCVNPHCSDSMLLGNNDKKLLNILNGIKNKFSINGPISADTAFLRENIIKTDVYLCAYHDQGLIPFKMLSFDKGINITMGLPFLRVSPAHGPAYDKAGSSKNISINSTVKCIDFLINH